MQKKLIARFSLALALGAALTASPALAQGKGKGHDKDRDRQEQQRPELRRRTSKEQQRLLQERARRQEELRREYESRHRSQSSRSRGKSVPPGWCVRGNPHNTVENCGYNGQRSRNDRYDGRYDNDRYGNDGRYGDYGRYGNSGSYDSAHRDFHNRLDRKYSELAARRPLDINWQLQLRREKQREHEEWHRQAGRGH
jgi:hypothetical protein